MSIFTGETLSGTRWCLRVRESVEISVDDGEFVALDLEDLYRHAAGRFDITTSLIGRGYLLIPAKGDFKALKAAAKACLALCPEARGLLVAIPDGLAKEIREVIYELDGDGDFHVHACTWLCNLRSWGDVFITPGMASLWKAIFPKLNSAEADVLAKKISKAFPNVDVLAVSPVA